MDNYLGITVFLLWIPQATGQLFNWLYWWQVKEYRADRLLVFLRSSYSRKNLKISLFLLKIVFLLFALFYPAISWTAVLLFILLDGYYFYLFIKGGLRRPILTKRAVNILAIASFLIVSIIFCGYWFGMSIILILICLEVALPASLILGVISTSLVARFVKGYEIKKAQETLKGSMAKVIGVTGSYGKTTTKDFIAQLLAQRFNTEKTTGSENTELGIARKTEKFVQKNTEFFVVEMGAYKKGEIATLAKIVSPSVGVITGIEPQHISLFGSFNAICEAKFELIESLPRNGIAIFNYSNKVCRKLAEKAAKLEKNLKIYGYYLGKRHDFVGPEVLSAEIRKADEDGIFFEVQYDGLKKKLWAPVKGTHFIENVSCAILVARIFGISWKAIEEACRKIKMSPKTMEVYRVGEASVIDDSFNSTPAGFASAVDYLSLFKGKKKAVITSGIIELGEISDSIHYGLGKKLRKVDTIILLNSDFFKSLKRGLGRFSDRLKLIEEPARAKEEFRKLIKNKNAVLLEGRVPSILLGVLGSQKK